MARENPLWSRRRIASELAKLGHDVGPTAEWAAQQIVQAVGPDLEIARLIRDRDKIFGAAFDRRVENLGLTQLRIAPRSPWQNGFAER